MIKHCIYLLSFLFIFITYSCKTETTTIVRNNSPKIDYPNEFLQGLGGQEGLDHWNSMKHLEFEIIKEDEKNEKHIIDLENRKARIENEKWILGFDGNEAWVSPDKKTYGKGSPRFYHNLIFYFFACPYVLADSGVNYEVREPIMMNGKKLIPVATSFNNGVGDSPDDEYIAHFDATTHELYLLLYTVTYYSKEKGKKFNALIFDEWKTFNGVKLPIALKGFKYTNGELGEKRYERRFTNITISENKPEQSLFEMPEIAEIDSLL